ncbi:MAG TPA: M14 family zinc carboxypeptidase, partial [Solirubrobacter sp.]
SLLGKPILALKITANARNVADGSRPSVLYSATNHAREWITPEVVRREAHWILNHQDDVRVQEILKKTELWFLPVQNPDGYDYTFTCGTGTATKVCGPGDANSNRLWRKTLRDNNANGIYGDQGDGVDPNRNFPEQWALDEEGSSSNPGNEDYRGPYANSEPENFAYDRLLRRIKPIANLNYHSAAQLLNSSFGFITNRPADDNTLARSLTGTDGDAAVDPYQPDQASDLYVTHGETVDWAYFQFGTIGFTPELDTAQTGGSSASSFVFPDDEDKVNAVFEKNLPLALNLAWSAAGDDFDRPRNFFDDASRYKVKATLDIEPTVFDVSYGGDQQVEAVVRKDLGPTDFQASVSGPGGRNQTLYLRGALYQGGERYGDVPGKYFQRVRATVPASFPPTSTTGTGATPRPVITGDTVTITVRAGGQEQVFSYKVVSTQQDKTKKRILVVAAEDYTGTAPNKTPYATAPRYLAQHVDALKAAGYEVDTYDIDAPPGTIKYPTFLGVLSHFDGVLYYTGDDLVPQDPGLTNYRRLSSATTLTGDTLISQWGAKGWFNLRDYLNEGGKVVIDGRNAHQTFASSSTSATAYSGYQFNPDPFYGFNYPADNLGDDNRPGSAFIRQHQVNNDIEQYFFGVGSRTGGAGTTTYNTAPIAPTANSIFAGVAPFTVDTAAGNDPTQDLDGNATPRAKSITRLRTFTSVLSSPSLQQPLRQEKAELDSQTTPAQTANGGVAVSTRDTVAFGFGLEQVDQSTREALVSKAFGYLLPATPDTTAPVVDFTYPLELKEVTAVDPVDLEVKGYDERGDIKEVRLFANDTLVKAKRSFPFQFRYYVPANAAANSVITFKAEAEDKAGNVKTITRQVRVVSAAAIAQTPIAVGVPILTGTPTVGSALTITNIAFINTPTSTRYVWLRDGEVIAGADKTTYT